MNALNEKFMRIQIFDNQDQYDKFWKYVNKFENYEEKISKKDSKYYALIQFNFHNCVPLNILIDAIENKYIEVQKTLIKQISIEILQHFQKFKREPIIHGNIQTKNIIIELHENQFFDQAKNNIEIKNIYFTNYVFKQNENDEQNIKKAFFQLWKLISKDASDQDFLNQQQLDMMSIQDILQNIQQMYVQDGQKQNPMRKIGNFIKQLVVETGQIKILQSKLKIEYPSLEENLEQKIQEFTNKTSEEFQQNQGKQIQLTNKIDGENQSECFNKLDCDKIQQTPNHIESSVFQKDQSEEEINRKMLEKEQQKIIKKEQQCFLEQLKIISLHNFIENVISQIFKNDEDKKGAEQKNQDVIKFIFDKCYLNIKQTFNILLDHFGGIQNTFNQKQKEINDKHYENFKFQIDLPIKEIVKVHFDQFLSITQKYIFSVGSAFSGQIEQQHQFIQKQLEDAYDAWITLKILELISDLI
ncbi:unnamed protein product [Paramecium sonneborni]|uniref:Uncharacterized protein n=1 Tax=Paramecium sonneborni TaxID=65129 RepID=A0A8S1KSG8_9CILI|nr:unnamed protein product [Paramecium sonneborni]